MNDKINEIKKYSTHILKALSVILILSGIWIIVDHYRGLSPQETSTEGLTKITSIVKNKKITPPSEDKTTGSPDTLYEVELEYQFGGTQKFYKTRVVDKNYYDRLFVGDSIVMYADRNNPYNIVLPDSRTSTHNFFNSRFFMGIIMIISGAVLWFVAGRKTELKAA